MFEEKNEKKKKMENKEKSAPIVMNLLFKVRAQDDEAPFKVFEVLQPSNKGKIV